MIKIAGYPMDLALSEEFSFPGEMTRRPVELGPDVSDHIRDLPEEITLECIVSDTPIGDIARDPTRSGAASSDALLALDEEPRPLPSFDALAKLRELKALRRPVTIETSLGTFIDMAILSIKVNRDAARSNGLFFTADFAKFNFVVNRRTKVRVKTPMAGAGGKAKPKVTVGQALRVDATITWRHGVPAGAPFRVGNIVEEVDVRYVLPSGLSRDETIAIGQAAPSSPVVKYFFGEGALSGQEITGIPRLDLIRDLERDAAAKRLDQQRIFAAPGSEIREAQNLPPGLDLSRFHRPAPTTFPKPQSPPVL
jgi:hypothetical protein